MAMRECSPEDFVFAKDGRRENLGPCWLWTGPLVDGYGQAQFEGRGQRIMRVIYRQLVGPIPEGLVLDHLCRVRRCVNPAHLEPVTNRENGLRGETIQARFFARTHCDNGHPFSGENLIIRPENGSRRCRKCCNERHRWMKAGKPVPFVEWLKNPPPVRPGVPFSPPPPRPPCACGEPHFAKGMCERHYMADYRKSHRKQYARHTAAWRARLKAAAGA
jgi:hypothetical protein